MTGFTTRSSREERQFNKELDKALKASVAEVPDVAVAPSGDTCGIVQKYVAKTTVVNQQHAEASINKESTSAVPEHLGTLDVVRKEACPEENIRGSQYRTVRSVSPADQSNKKCCDSDPRESSHEEDENNRRPEKDCVSSTGGCVSSKAKFKGKGSVIVPEKASSLIPSKSTASIKPSGKGNLVVGHCSNHLLVLGTKKATVSEEQSKLKYLGASPSVRVGLSRNIRTKPLHPKLKIVSQ